MRTPSFSVLLSVTGTLLPALVINNQVLNMSRPLLQVFWTSDVVRMRASFHTYRPDYVTALQVLLSSESRKHALAQQSGCSLNATSERGITKQGVLPICTTLPGKSQQKAPGDHAPAKDSNTRMQFEFVLFSAEPLKVERQSNAGSRRSERCEVRRGIRLQTQMM